MMFSYQPPSDICDNSDGCHTTATTAAIKAARNSTTMAGQRRAIITPVSTGTNSSHGEIKKVLSNWFRKFISPLPDTFITKPATVKMSSETQNVGIVVFIIYRICVKRGVPETLEARTVVSDNGESLSPK